MKATIIENNQRRNGEIIINGWSVDSSDIEIRGTEKQVAWCREIIRDVVGGAIMSVGKSQGLLNEAGTTEADWAKLESKVEAFLAQIASVLNGVDAHIIIDNRRYGIQGIVGAAKKATA